VAFRPPDPPLTDGIVVLRPFDARDLPALEESSRDPDIRRWFGSSRRSARELLENKRRGWVDGTGAFFAVCDAQKNAACLGQVFVEPGEDRRADVGFWLLPWARGGGRAVRAVTLASLWAFREAGIERLQLWVEPANVPSTRVAERSGFQAEGVLRSYIEREGVRRDVVFYSLLPGDIAAEHSPIPPARTDGRDLRRRRSPR
jgi:[ribosomal protein S5]-alanine N-acetyltransferase